MESSDGEQKEEAQRICAHIMQVEEYRELSSSIIRGYAVRLICLLFIIAEWELIEMIMNVYIFSLGFFQKLFCVISFWLTTSTFVC